MSFFQDFSSTFSAISRGASATQRAAKIAKLRTQLADVTRSRSEYAAQLGAGLYELTKNDPRFTEGNESLYSGIEHCDEERNRLQEEIAALEEQAQQEAATWRMYTCQQCGKRVRATDTYCSGCGRLVADIVAQEEAEQARQREADEAAAQAAAQKIICPQCGRHIQPHDAFCPACGAKIEETSEEADEQIISIDPIEVKTESEEQK